LVRKLKEGGDNGYKKMGDVLGGYWGGKWRGEYRCQRGGQAQITDGRLRDKEGA